VRESRHRQHELEIAWIARPGRHDRIDDREELLVPAEEKVAGLHEPQGQQVARPPVQDAHIAVSGQDRIAANPGLGRGQVGGGIGWQRKSVGGLDGPRDRRQGVRALRQGADGGANGLRPMEFRMNSADIAQVCDGIADGAQEVIEGQ
jgi:hypothetical protein